MWWRSFLSVHAIVAVLGVCIGCAPSVEEATRNMNDLDSAVTGLLASPADDAFLIVAISGSPDFVQVAGYRGSGALLDFPQITDRQKQLRPKIEEVCEKLGLIMNVTRSPDGSEFLDADLPSNAEEVAGILKRILAEVYDASESSELEFEANGFDLPAI